MIWSVSPIRRRTMLLIKLNRTTFIASRTKLPFVLTGEGM